MARDVYRASVRGAARYARDLRVASRAVQVGIRRALDDLSKIAEDVFFAWAPKDTREMADSIEARFSNRTVRPAFALTVRAVREGFDYLPVTRFGHRLDVITADRGRRSATAKGKGHAPALAVYVNGRESSPIFRASVQGAFPVYDWVEQARNELDHEADAAEDRLGRAIDRSIR